MQVFLIFPFLMGIFDFIFTIYQEVRGDVAKFQYLTPIVIVVSMVSTAKFMRGGMLYPPAILQVYM